jgi:hypothetical protein
MTMFDGKGLRIKKRAKRFDVYDYILKYLRNFSSEIPSGFFSSKLT